jgi:tRNA 5-methylaminomethyl-2-thiouridine biosynthesis bifunctional protein
MAEDGTPWSEAYGDIYHSADGGPGQAQHVFLEGNGLPWRWRGKGNFVILETGFGTGLNFLTTWAAWRQDNQRPRRLHYLSVEKHPFRGDDLTRLHARWPEFADLALKLRQAWPTLTPGFHRLAFEANGIVLTLLLGDAEVLLPQLQARLDAIYLDGFSPAKNPDLWSPALFKRLARMANPGATVATWSVAGEVRRCLEAVGFSTARRPGFGHKREMLAGCFKPKPWQASPATPSSPRVRRAIVIGAGLAGTACCERLASRGWQTTLIDRHPGPAQEASGNLAGVVMPLVSRDDNIASRLSRAAYLYTLRHWQTLESGRSRKGGNPGEVDWMPACAGMTNPGLPDTAEAHPRWSSCGVLQLARDAHHESVQRALVAEMGFPEEFVSFLSQEAAEAQVGHSLPYGGWLFRQGGWTHPPGICQANLEQAGHRVGFRLGVNIARLTRDGGQWQAFDADGELIAAAPVVIIASGADAAQLDQTRHLPLQRIRGQVSLIPDGRLPPLPLALCREGYATPATQGFHAVGASYDVDDDDPIPRREDNAGNLARLERLLPGAAGHLDPASLDARVGFRAVPPDRLPMVGALPDHDAALASAATQLKDLPRHDGLYAALGYASRGLVWASLMAELLASQITGEPLPIERDLADAVDPGRFLLKRTRRAGL